MLTSVNNAAEAVLCTADWVKPATTQNIVARHAPIPRFFGRTTPNLRFVLPAQAFRPEGFDNNVA